MLDAAEILATSSNNDGVIGSPDMSEDHFHPRAAPAAESGVNPQVSGRV
ncbi:hypothetical protein ART_1939 [Arthrobacter sp. PAMC 25486]|nr:hypothetical protein ART_1939 [Arthrobacter sp. PAMC 25486]